MLNRLNKLRMDKDGILEVAVAVRDFERDGAKYYEMKFRILDRLETVQLLQHADYREPVVSRVKYHYDRMKAMAVAENEEVLTSAKKFDIDIKHLDLHDVQSFESPKSIIIDYKDWLDKADRAPRNDKEKKDLIERGARARKALQEKQKLEKNKKA